MWAALLAMIAIPGPIFAATPTQPPEPPATAQAIAELDGFTRGLATAGEFSGAVLVARDGQVLYAQAFGLQDERAEAPNTVDTRFNLASLGKMFTAVAVLQQVAQGRLGLDTSVGEVLVDYPNEAFADKVTVRQLLTHTAGAGDIDLFGVDKAAARQRVQSVADMVALHDERAPGFEPGTAQKYGNFGHVVLGRMVEVLSGEDFESYLERHVFAPAGMTHTSAVDCTDRAPDLAVGYVTVDGERSTNCATLPARAFPAGGQVSTVGDILAFVEALRGGKLLPPALFAEAIRTQHEFMGLGFFATGYGPGVPERDFRWGHGGSADGICTEARTYPATGETVIVLSNVDAPRCYAVSNFLHQQWSARAAEASPPPPERVLFVGNSLLYVGNAPAVFSALAEANGQAVQADMMVQGGATLAQRLEDGSVARALDAHPYTALVLQERGGDLLCMFGPESCVQSRQAIDRLAEMGRAHGVQVMLLGTYQPLPQASRALVEEEAAAAAASGIPYLEVSERLQRLRADAPDLAWFADDGMHPGADLALLDAMLVYRQVFGALPEAGPLTVTAPIYTTHSGLVAELRTANAPPPRNDTPRQVSYPASTMETVVRAIVE